MRFPDYLAPEKSMGILIGKIAFNKKDLAQCATFNMSYSSILRLIVQTGRYVYINKRVKNFITACIRE